LPKLVVRVRRADRTVPTMVRQLHLDSGSTYSFRFLECPEQQQQICTPCHRHRIRHAQHDDGRVSLDKHIRSVDSTASFVFSLATAASDNVLIRGDESTKIHTISIEKLNGLSYANWQICDKIVDLVFKTI
jgi:hypothetical protein